MGRRQANVDDRDVDGIAFHARQQIVGVAALSNYVHSGLAEETRNAFSEQHAVFGERYAHGISALNRVPPPRGVQMRNLPPSASTRSARPRRPEPRSVSAPPIPSSTTSTTICPSSRPTSTVAPVACACFVIFARLSDTT